MSAPSRYDPFYEISKYIQRDYLTCLVGKAFPERDVVIDQRFRVGVVREITLLSVPKVSSDVIGEVSCLDVNNLLHGGRCQKYIRIGEVGRNIVISPKLHTPMVGNLRG